ncbi:hypothetical protein [Paenibacillus pasadenensis]|uniref:hypothetical protein n=1 Tax=Paenibacillus pasadenensis TaxID=217090 RepID=UPI00048BC351|nr:hypothetical protein [Paenibacillus pasadenensis]
MMERKGHIDEASLPRAEVRQAQDELNLVLQELSAAVQADAYYIADETGEGDCVVALHHAGEPVLHLGMVLPLAEAPEEEDVVLRFHRIQVRIAEEAADVKKLGMLRKERSFSGEEKDRLLRAADSRAPLAPAAGRPVESGSSGLPDGGGAAAGPALITKGERLRQLAFDMMNGLTNIDGMAQLLADTTLDQSQLDMLDELRMNAEHLASLAQTLLKHADQEDSWVGFDEHPFSILDLSKELTDKHGESESPSRLTCWVSAEVPHQVHGRKEQLSELLDLLLQIAREEPEVGSTRLNIHVNSVNSQDGQLDLLIQLLLDRQGGSGPGSAAWRSEAKRIVELNGGELWEQEGEAGWGLHMTFQVRRAG